MDYDVIAKSYNGLYEEEQIKKLKIVEQYIKVHKNSRLLDIGCGTGISTNYFKCNSIGIDKSQEMIKNGRGNLIFGKSESLPFKDKTFDIILCITSIHNFKNPKKALKEILRVKKSKAQVVITLLKKSKNYKVLKKLIQNNFKAKEIDSEKDTIFISLV